MARRAVLGGGSLTPFGGGGVDFGAFDIGPSATQARDEAAAAADRSARLSLNASEIQWSAGYISNEEYLAALQAYAATADETTTTGQDAIARVQQYEYRFQRAAIVNEVERGNAGLEALLAYDRSMLSGLNTGSEEYDQRLGYYQTTQGQLFSQMEGELVDQYNDGQMTTAQLNAAYLDLGASDLFADSRQIREALEERIANLADRALAEVDSQTLSDYQAGRISPSQFIAYGAAARSRYAQGTEQFNAWTERLTDANDRSRETALLYRYDLSQQYANLQKFIASSAPLAGGTSTSTTTRTILGSDGQWHTVKSTSTKPVAPSASEVAAFARRQQEVASAKAQLVDIEAKLVGVGGFVSTDSATLYYQRQLGKFAVGSDEWYAVQTKLDDLADRKAQETLLRSQGIRISFPKPGGAAAVATTTGAVKAATGGAGKTTGAAPTRSDDGGSINLDDFMASIAKVESGGRYTAQNKSSGAYGKYQIMPANWAGWARKYVGDASAPQTPENQEKVVRGKMTDLYAWLGDWRAVAHWWLTGGAKETQTNPAGWSGSSRRYVDNVMAGLGQGPTSGSALTRNAAAVGAPASPRGGAVAPAAPVAKPAAKATTGPLRVLTGIEQERRTGEAVATTQGARFPTGLTAEAFQTFYAQYSAAFQSGSTEFTVNAGGEGVHYWVGDDVLERRDLMRNIDELRVSMFREQMVAYADTGSAETKANQFDQSIEDAARHELMILATIEPSGRVYTAQYSPNPIAQGLVTLDKAKAAIADYTSLAEAALKRGDLTAAYSYSQLATERAARTDETLRRFAAIAQRDVDAIEQTFGVGAEEALGADKTSSFLADMARLTNFGLELDEVVNVGAPTLTDLLKVVRKDATGDPIFDALGPGGQLSLDPRYHFEVSASGEVEAVPTRVVGGDYLTGKAKPGIEGMAFVDYLVAGGRTIPAYVKFATGDVGWITDANGQRVPVQGKFYSRETADGGRETWYEDPFTGKWSSTMIGYKPGSGFAAVMGDDGKPVIQYSDASPRGPKGQAGGEGFTYSLNFDDKTGTYVVSRSRPGGFLREAVEDEVLGSLRPGQAVYETFQQAGFTRDLTGLSSDEKLLAALNAPFVGGTAQQYTAWRANFQSPFRRAPSELESIMAEKALVRAIRSGVPTPAAVTRSDSRESLLEEQAARRQLQPPVLAPLTPRAPLATPVVNAATGFVTTPKISAATGFTLPAAPIKPKTTTARAPATTTTPPRAPTPSVNASTGFTLPPPPKLAPLPVSTGGVKNPLR